MPHPCGKEFNCTEKNVFRNCSRGLCFSLVSSHVVDDGETLTTSVI